MILFTQHDMLSLNKQTFKIQHLNKHVRILKIIETMLLTYSILKTLKITLCLFHSSKTTSIYQSYCVNLRCKLKIFEFYCSAQNQNNNKTYFQTRVTIIYELLHVIFGCWMLSVCLYYYNNTTFFWVIMACLCQTTKKKRISCLSTSSHIFCAI